MKQVKRGRKPCPVGADTPSARAREAIAEALCFEIRSWGQPQGQAAARLGMHRTNLNRLLRGELSRFALGSLVDIAAAAGIDVQLVLHANAGTPASASMPLARDRPGGDFHPRDGLAQATFGGSGTGVDLLALPRSPEPLAMR